MNAAARSLLAQAIKANPRDLPAYHRLAALYESDGEFRRAELVLLRSIEVDPYAHETWRLLGIHYGNLGKWRHGAHAFEQACSLRPEEPLHWTGYARALIAAQNIRAADEVRARLLDRFADMGETHVIDGHLNRVRGLAADAARSYGRALQLAPGLTEAMFNLAELLEPAVSAPLARELQELQQRPDLSLADRTNACFALARIHERAGDTDVAFRHYQEGNAAARELMNGAGQRYDPAEMEIQAGWVMRTFSAEKPVHPLEALDIGVRLIFIVGLPRSGTTLIERILGAHSRVSSGGELPLMQECLTDLQNHLAPSAAARMARASREPEAGYLLGLRERYLDGLFERELDGDYVTDKLPANFTALGLIRTLFPDSIIIHCIRDPVATCWSLYCANFGAHTPYYNSFEHLAHYHRVYGKLMAHWEKALEPRPISVRYEDIVTRSRSSIEDLLRSCGLEWQDACLNFHESSQPVYTASMQQVRQPLYRSSLSRWKAFENHLAPLREALAESARDA